jgi:hypothetical protein
VTTLAFRIRGRVGINDDDQKYYFELSMWEPSGETLVGPPWMIGPWETEEIAHAQLKKAIEIVRHELQKEHSAIILDTIKGGVVQPRHSDVH